MLELFPMTVTWEANEITCPSDITHPFCLEITGFPQDIKLALNVHKDLSYRINVFVDNQQNQFMVPSNKGNAHETDDYCWGTNLNPKGCTNFLQCELERVQC